jgi:thiol-disulfide isomerase/thioredoxin
VLVPASTAADTSRFDLETYRGKVVYLDFWASWCGPCKQSFPWMRAMQEHFASQGFAVVAVNLDRDREAALEFLKKNPVAFPIIYDPQGVMAREHKVEAMPSSFVYDRTGKLRAVHQGFKDSDKTKLEAELRDLLAESAAEAAP